MLSSTTLITLFATLGAAFPSLSAPDGDLHIANPDSNGYLKPRIAPHRNIVPANAYTISKRNTTEPTTTNFTFSDTHITWGCNVDPAATLGNLTSMCPDSGSCLSSEPYSLGVEYTTPAPGTYAPGTNPETLVVTASGHYNGAIIGQLIEAIQIAVNAPNVVQWTRGQKYAYSEESDTPHGPRTERYTGQCDLATMSSQIGVTVSDLNGMPAYIDITISLVKPDTGFCSMIAGGAGLTGAVAGVIEEGATLAGAMGIIGALCSVGGS